MFQPEFRKQSIEFDYSIDQSYGDHVVSWVMADLARVGQILINLVGQHGTDRKQFPSGVFKNIGCEWHNLEKHLLRSIIGYECYQIHGAEGGPQRDKHICSRFQGEADLISSKCGLFQR